VLSARLIWLRLESFRCSRHALHSHSPTGSGSVAVGAASHVSAGAASHTSHSSGRGVVRPKSSLDRIQATPYALPAPARGISHSPAQDDGRVVSSDCSLQ